MNIVLVDISTYSMTLPPTYRSLLMARLQAQHILQTQRIGIVPIRPGLTYSRGLLLVAASLQRAGHRVIYVVYNDPQDRQRLPTVLAEAQVVGLHALTPS